MYRLVWIWLLFAGFYCWVSLLTLDILPCLLQRRQVETRIMVSTCIKIIADWNEGVCLNLSLPFLRVDKVLSLGLDPRGELHIILQQPTTEDWLPSNRLVVMNVRFDPCFALLAYLGSAYLIFHAPILSYRVQSVSFSWHVSSCHVISSFHNIIDLLHVLNSTYALIPHPQAQQY